jgi:D-alanine-D-alanine ligase
MNEPRPSVLVLYNFVGEDEYERLKDVDPSKLDFTPEYDIKVPTVLDEYRAVAKALRRQGFRARVVNIQENLGKLERALKRNPPDVVFNLVEYLHDDPGLEPHVAALFELHQIAYTGSRPFVLALCHKKEITKQVLIANGVRTPKFALLHEPRLPKRRRLHYPLIVKPAREDASSGIERESVAHDDEALRRRLEYVYEEFGTPMLVEEFIDGQELHISILGNYPPEMLPPIAWDFSELPSDHPPIISFAAKWNPLSEVYHRVHSVCPAPIQRRVLRNIERVALEAYEATGCRDYARLDIRLGKRNEVYVLEMNPNPDLTEGVSFMESAEQAGYSFSETLKQIVGFALERKRDLDAERARRAVPQPSKPASPEALTATLRGMSPESSNATDPKS